MVLSALRQPPSAIDSKFRKRFVRALPSARRKAVIQEYWTIHGREIRALSDNGEKLQRTIAQLGNVSPSLHLDLLPFATEMRRKGRSGNRRSISNLRFMLAKVDEMLASDERSALVEAIELHLNLLESVDGLLDLLEATMARLAAEDEERITSQRSNAEVSGLFVQAIPALLESMVNTAKSSVSELTFANRRLERGAKRVASILERIEARQAGRT